MTFQITLDERMEAHTVYARSQNRFWRVMPLFFGSIIALMSVGLWNEPSLIGGIWWALMVGIVLYAWVWEPYKIKRNFRRECGGNVTPPVSCKFYNEGFIWRFKTGEYQLPWEHIRKRVEGRTVWIFVVKAKKPFFLILPKRALDSEEGRAEWAIVETVFAPRPSAPIAAPH